MLDQSTLWNEIQNHGFITRLIGYKNDEEATKGNYNYQYWSLPMENAKLEKGDFFYKGENDFVHFTSLEIVYNILNSRCMRLYNLVNMDDRYELEYGLQELNYPQNEKFKKDKEELFSLSMCSYPEISSDETKEHLLWKLYGNNGYGVMLRLQFKNDPLMWYQYHLSKIFYDTSNMEAVKTLHSQPGNNIFLDPKLSTFFKSKIYSFEHEVRLIFDKRSDVSVSYKDRNDNLLYPIVYPDKFKRQENIFYFELPLLNFFPFNSVFFNAPNVQRMDLEIPKLFISDIILGYRYSKADIDNISTRIAAIDPNIIVSTTNLKKYY